VKSSVRAYAFLILILGNDKTGGVRIVGSGAPPCGLFGMDPKAPELSVLTVVTYMRETRSFRRGQRICSSTIVRCMSCGRTAGDSGPAPHYTVFSVLHWPHAASMFGLIHLCFAF